MKAYRQGGMVDIARWWHAVDNAPKRPIASRTSGGGQPDHLNALQNRDPPKENWTLILRGWGIRSTGRRHVTLECCIVAAFM